MDRCGIYQIRCAISGKSYVGSSCRIEARWHTHRRQLRKKEHRSPRLQQAWNKHGEAAFDFSVLEECAREDLFKREQFHIDQTKRDYNSMPIVRVITKEMHAKMCAAQRLLAEKRTHCPHGHEYTPENSYYGKRSNDKRCNQCNRERVAKRLDAETPEQREARRVAVGKCYLANREKYRALQKLYADRTKEQKRLYDIAYRDRKKAERTAELIQ
jgi:group I intron endonuclease